MLRAENNYAFIDSQNVNLGVQELGWKLDFKKFRIYLLEKYQARKAYLFLGRVPRYEKLYKSLRNFGYTLIFKEVALGGENPIKGNCDAELILQAMIDCPEYDRAIVVTGDGDFTCLIKYLYVRNKLECLLVPNEYRCSGFLKRAARGKLLAINGLKDKLAYKTKRGTT